MMKNSFWIWNISQCEGGDPLQIASVAKQSGLKELYVKIADGVYPFNYDWKTKRDLARELVLACKALGVDVWGWQYTYGASPEQEARVFSDRINALGVDGAVVDAEIEYKNKPGNARRYMVELRRLQPKLEIGISTYRFPQYHPEFPFKEFLEYCDANYPQVYWLEATNPGHQLEVCKKEYEKFDRVLPMRPIGTAYKWNGWRPTADQLKEFIATARQLGMDTVGYWSWEHCRRDLPELWSVATQISDVGNDGSIDIDKLNKIFEYIEAAQSALAKVEELKNELRS